MWNDWHSLLIAMTVPSILFAGMAYMSHRMTIKEATLIRDYRHPLSSARENLRRRNSFISG